jgi:hypothetical protein
MYDNQKENYKEVLSLINNNVAENKKQKEILGLQNSFESLTKKINFETLLNFNKRSLPYLAANYQIKHKSQIQLLLHSPDFSFTDFRWLCSLLNIKKHYKRNKKNFERITD